jgi:serine/threonine protein kinase
MDTARTRVHDPLQANFRDGLGTRYRRDGVDGPLEILLLNHQLTTIPAFEFLVRERVNRLAHVRHDCFARIRDVERASDSAATLAVVSDRVPGVRLSRMLSVAEQNLLPLDVDSALCLIRQLVTAVALLHEAASDACHGALAPERIIITPAGRVVIVEHVFGAALEQLKYSRERYWKDLRIALPVIDGASRLNRPSDVVQIGAIALALLVGRPLGESEYPASLETLAGGAFGLGGEFEPFPEWLRSWLTQTLWLDPMHSFASAIEARQSLDASLKAAGHTASQCSAALESFLA